MTFCKRIARNTRGAAMVEFALVAPILITLLVGAMNIGIYFFAQNSVNNAVEVAAREAAIYPTPSDTQLQALFDDALLKEESTVSVVLGVSHGTATNGTKYVTLSTSYNVPVNLILGKVNDIPVRSERRVYVQD